MREIKLALLFTWFMTLIIPAFLLLIKITIFIWNNDFREWHIMILWALSIPITTTLLMLARLKEDDKK
jgi:hypothetical protein